MHSGNLSDMTITELQEIAVRQQSQIDINQQLLNAREKRLNLLKLEEAKNQKLTQLSQHQQQQQQHNQQNHPSNNKVEHLRQNMLSHELKIFKLKQLKNQLFDNKLSNSNMYSELDLIKNLFSDKERDLYKAINKVNELNKQIEQLKRLKTATPTITKQQQQQQTTTASQNMTELDRLKQELQIRNKLNEQQAKKIQQQQELFNKKQSELGELDRRIDELKGRIRNKRTRLQNYNQQQQPQQQQQQHANQNDQYADRDHSSRGLNGQQIQQQLAMAEASKSSPSKAAAKFATKQEIANTYMNKTEAFQKYRLMQNTTPTPQQNFNQNQQQHAPSSNNNMDENENISTSTNSSLNANNNNSQPASTTSSSIGSMHSPLGGANLNNNNNSSLHNQSITSAHDTSTGNTTLPSHLKLEFDKMKYLPDMVKTIKKRHSISEIEGSGNTMPPLVVQKLLERHKEFNNAQQLQHQLQMHNLNTPVHQQNQQQQPGKLSKIVETVNESPPPPSPINTPNSGSLNVTNVNSSQTVMEISKPVVVAKASSPPPNHPPVLATTTQAQIVPIVTNQTSTNTAITIQNQPVQSHQQTQQHKLTTFLPTQAKEQQPHQTIEQQSANIEVVSDPTVTSKSTKSIIKQTTVVTLDPNGQNDVNSTETAKSNANNNTRRVNFDPHALLLDAAVEGELDLVAKCARLVRNISEPNDEGITALHNSVCAGHFDIVRYLVEQGCDVNFADNDGWTPLHCAASCNNLPMLRFLVESGASVFATTLSDNETAARKCEEDEDGYQACHDYLCMIEKNLGDREVNGGVVHALYTYEPVHEDELRFECGDRLAVLDKHEDRANNKEEEDESNGGDGWWTCRLVGEEGEEADMEGKVGLVPRNYLGLYPRVQPSSTNNLEESTIC